MRIRSREQFGKLVCALGQLAFTLVREIRKRVGDRKYRGKFAKEQIVVGNCGRETSIFLHFQIYINFILIRDVKMIYFTIGIFNFSPLFFLPFRFEITKAIVNSCDPLIYPQNLSLEEFKEISKFQKLSLIHARQIYPLIFRNLKRLLIFNQYFSSFSLRCKFQRIFANLQEVVNIAEFLSNLFGGNCNVTNFTSFFSLLLVNVSVVTLTSSFQQLSELNNLVFKGYWTQP